MKKISRRTFVQSAVATTIATKASSSRAFAMANDEVRIGFIGCGGRAGEHMSVYSKLKGVAITGLCDPDQKRMMDSKDKFGQVAKTWADLRPLLDDKNIDAVVVATCNHWHCLAAIWAMQAGKDVYVEKPLSHSQWEGRQTVLAARKYNRVCQVGTQQRSDPMQAEIKKFLHEEKAIGNILSARVNRFGVRSTIGRRTTPLQIDPRIDYNLWLGPAEDKPIFRDNLQYDWHWDWNTGSGEMGNWGVHVLDDLRNIVLLDKVSLPKRIMGGGGRMVWNDAGETPNVHFVYFDTGIVPVVIGLTNLPDGPAGNRSPKCPGPGSGYIAYCEGGRFEGQRGSGVAYDKEGKEIKRFRGNSGGSLHQQNFIEAVRARDPKKLNTDVELGHHSTGWCNLANVAVRTGAGYSQQQAEQFKTKEWLALLEEMKQHLSAHNLKMDSQGMMLGPVLTMDSNSEKFVGEHSSEANAFLKRAYRAPFVVPEIG